MSALVDGARIGGTVARLDDAIGLMRWIRTSLRHEAEGSMALTPDAADEVREVIDLLERADAKARGVARALCERLLGEGKAKGD